MKGMNFGSSNDGLYFRPDLQLRANKKTWKTHQRHIFQGLREL